MSTIHLHHATASKWVSDHLQTDARKFTEAGLEFGGRLAEVTHDSYAQRYRWYLDGREVGREAVEHAIDIAFLG